MINFKVVCDCCRREVPLLNAVVYHENCHKELVADELRWFAAYSLPNWTSADSHHSTTEVAELLPERSEAEVMEELLW